MSTVDINTDEAEELQLKGLINHISGMAPDARRATMMNLPEMEVQILSELALLYEAYEVCGTARDVLQGG